MLSSGALGLVPLHADAAPRLTGEARLDATPTQLNRRRLRGPRSAKATERRRQRLWPRDLTPNGCTEELLLDTTTGDEAAADSNAGALSSLDAAVSFLPQQPPTLQQGADATDTTESFTVLLSNTRSIKDPVKRALLQQQLDKHEPDFVALNETWLDERVPHLELAGYTCVSFVESLRRG